MSEPGQNEPVLTDGEKDALLEGVASGEVEVHGDRGPHYATVTEFEIMPRNRIVTNSFPRLQGINRKLAGHVTKAATALLNEKVEVAPAALDTCTWGEFGEQATQVALIYEFEPKPLDGAAVMHLQKGLVDHMVEVFYGGSKSNPPRHASDNFTPGECKVVALFCETVLTGIVETWQGLIELQPEYAAVHQSTDIVEVVESGALVITSEFEIRFAEEQFYFHVVWPTATLASLLPVLEGQKRDRDPVEDARWEQVIRGRLPEARVAINTCIGKASLSLRHIAGLATGDIIDIDQPRIATVYADHVPVLEGRFGVHDGSYALEATRWLKPAIEEPAH